MKKKLLLIIPFLMLILCLASCNKNKQKDFVGLVESIYNSEEILAGYNEVNTIKDSELEIYNKTTNFRLERGQTIKSEVSMVERKLSTSGSSTYDEVVTNYKTVDDVKYTEINGNTFQNSYTIPTYYLTFVLSEEFLEEGYELIVDDNNYTLKANVLDNKVSSLFLNKSVGNIKGLKIEINVIDGRLTKFNANYKSETGFDIAFNTEYLYAVTGKAKAVFYLEGGICQNTKDRVSYVYDFNGNKIDTLIVDPNVLETNPQDMILKSGYHIEGWYRTKTVNSDGSITYSDKWDFSKDRMTLDGVTLYANWEINRLYTYELYYYNEANEAILLDSYEVKEGEKFNDLFIDNKTVDGYTSLRYLDEQGNPWNSNFKHPGGDSDVAVKVFLDLIEGEYSVVKTARELTRALTRGENIYLTADIDLDGDEICFDSYSGTILGNGHKISNFEIDYDSTRNGLKGPLDDLTTSKDHLYISLFFELENATIKDVTFEDALIDINTSLSQIKYLIVSPLAIKATNTNIENVVFSGNITNTKTPACEIETITDGFFYSANEDVIINNSSVNIEG